MDIPVLIISADTDVFYNGKRSPIYEKREMIIYENCEFMLMDRPNHNEHYTYFLTDAALEYQESNPSENIDKEVYMEHDEQILGMIIDFFGRTNTSTKSQTQSWLTKRQIVKERIEGGADEKSMDKFLAG